MLILSGGVLSRVKWYIIIKVIDLQWWFVRNFMPKTHERWEREIKEQDERDFLEDYNHEMFWQQQNGR